MVEYIDSVSFSVNANKLMDNHWKSWKFRWTYFEESVRIIKTYLEIGNENEVLEAGTMGVSVIKNCDTIDYDKKWNYAGKNPTFLHDLRNIPWPISYKRYKLFIALRVWQHLGDKQELCFKEAKRISDNLLIVVPHTYKNNYGITLEQLVAWNDGVPPTYYKNVSGSNFIYFWGVKEK
jgi:hypothetical protein